MMRLVLRFIPLLLLMVISSCPVNPEAEAKRVQLAASTSGHVPGLGDIVFHTSFGGKGTGQGQFSAIGGIAARDGKVYVGDTNIALVQVFDYKGNFLYSFGSGIELKKSIPPPIVLAKFRDSAEENLLRPEVISLLKQHLIFSATDLAIYENEILVLNNLYSFGNEKKATLTAGIMRFTPSGEYLGFLSIAGVSPTFMDVDPETHTVVFSDILNNGIFVTDILEGTTLVSTNSKYQSSYAEFLETVYGVEETERRRKVYREWTSAGSGDDKFDGVSGVAFFRDKVLAVDRMNKRIKVFSRDGRRLSIINARPQGATKNRFDDPVDIAVSKEGIVFLTDASPFVAAVLAFSSRFAPLFALGHRDMKQPQNLAITDDGYVFVTDTLSQMVFVFGPERALGKRERRAGTGGRISTAEGGTEGEADFNEAK